MRFLATVLISIFSVALYAQELELPPLRGPVQDDADILSEDFVYKASTSLSRIYKDGGPQIQIVTVPSLQDYTIEQFTIYLAEKWKIGRKGKNDGVILLVAPNERKVRIEVGSDLEGDITDYDSNLIINNAIIPYFKSGNYEAGIQQGMGSILKKLGLEQYAIKGSAPVSVRKQFHKKHNSKAPVLYFIVFIAFVIGSAIKNTLARGLTMGSVLAGGTWFLSTAASLSIGFIVIIFIIGFFLGITNLLNFLLTTGGRGGGYYGGGGFGGGSSGGGWSGGGGGFSGGGSSGSW